jgi:hypothetical protein
VYVHSAGGPCAEEGVEVDGAAWLKREGKVLHIIPCGDLGPWERAVALAYPRGPVDLLAGKPPADRGCRRIVLDATRLLGKPAAEVRGPVRALDERRVEVTLGGDREYRVE